MAVYRDIDFSQDMRKLKKMLKLIPIDRKHIAERLIVEIAFMGETLTELRRIVREKGVVEDFKQGKQQFIRESPALKSYGSIVQRYSLLYRQFNDQLPKPEIEDTALEEILNALKRLEGEPP